MMGLVYSLLFILSGFVYIFFLLKRKEENLNAWDLSMKMKGFIGGILLIIFGIVMFFKNT